jgi:hypothetical protein
LLPDMYLNRRQNLRSSRHCTHTHTHTHIHRCRCHMHRHESCLLLPDIHMNRRRNLQGCQHTHAQQVYDSCPWSDACINNTAAAWLPVHCDLLRLFARSLLHGVYNGYHGGRSLDGQLLPLCCMTARHQRSGSQPVPLQCGPIALEMQCSPQRHLQGINSFSPSL